MSTNFPHGVSVYGGMPLGLGDIPPGGDVYFLNPSHPYASDNNDGRSLDAPFATLEGAEDKLTANQNDVLFYVAGNTGVTLNEAVVWDKSYTHLIGLCAPSHVGQRARFFQLSTLTGASPLLTISGSGCIFRNFYIFQGVADATSLINVSVSGSRNLFENVHFAGGGHASMAIDSCASLHISGGSENRFRGCTIGIDTIALGDGGAGLVYAATGGATRNIFQDCLFKAYAGNAGAVFVELLGNSGLDREHLFQNCQFINLAAQQMTTAIKVAAGFDPANKRILLDERCHTIGAGEWDSGNSGLVYHAGGAVTAGGNTGIWQATNST